MSKSESRQGRVPIQLPLALILLGLATWAILLWRSDVRGDPLHLTVSGTVEGESVSVGSKVGGRLLAVHMHEGDSLSAGQLIAEFDVPELAAQRAQLLSAQAEASALLAKLAHGARPEEIAQDKARVDGAKAQLAELEQGTRSEDIAAAEAAWRAAEVQYNLALNDLQRAQALFDAAVIPRSQLDAAQARVDSQRQAADAAMQQYEKAQAGPRETQLDAARAQVAQAQAALDLLYAGSRKEDIDGATARVETIGAQIAGLDVSLAESRVLAPSPGIVLTVNHQPGDLLAPGTAVCNILLVETYYVQVFVPEDKLAWAQPGAKATLAVDAYPGQAFQGQVTYLAAEGEFTPRNLQTKEKRVEQVFRCKVRVSESGGKLRPGMVCDVTFSRPGASEVQ